MSPTHQHLEHKVLRFSSLLAAAFAVGGLVIGMLLGSIVIAFDGVYSLVSLLLTLLSLATAKVIHAPRDAHFPNGRAVLEPLVIAIKGAVIMGVVIYSMYSAVQTLFSGGVSLNIGVASGFALVNILGCAYAWKKIQLMSKSHQSGLMDAEAKQWKMDTILSVAVGAGFLMAWAITHTTFARYAVYADPVMMLLISGYFIKVPLEMMVGSGRELLQMSPNEALVEEVQQSVDAIDQAHNVTLNSVLKVGPELRIELLVKPQANRVMASDELHRMKAALNRTLAKVPLDVKLTLNMAS
ncbi:cobalt-zinc-cadmium resistance protein [Vibrio sp. qd031]|uniref:cation transporter n=1 Tax=Vibrio sp. qd031 TaxID=1603038 RepID=UPI000A10F156|nr:cation transporter [Vibrio sp. qd031]ORT48265.1 cobalt-zinc-cadmium resistance protein [Vibrio sp. qd031]